MDRRTFLASGIAAATLGTAAASEGVAQYDVVTLDRNFPAGQIHVISANHHLYLTLGGTQALRYDVAVGAVGRQFKGTAVISRKALWPKWRPTTNMIRQEPSVYGPYRNGLPGRHPQNPMGAAALYLAQGGRETYYRIHGTHQPWTMGQSFSSGCVRLTNENITDLYRRVGRGATVFVT